MKLYCATIVRLGLAEAENFGEPQTRFPITKRFVSATISTPVGCITQSLVSHT